MQSLNLLTVLQYFMGKDWLIPAALSRVQGQLEIAKKSPKRKSPDSNKHTSGAITTPDLPAYEFSVRNSDLPAITLLRTVFCFAIKQNQDASLRQCKNIFNGIVKSQINDNQHRSTAARPTATSRSERNGPAAP